jgi:hypothetical protein
MRGPRLTFCNWCEGQGIGELGRVQPVHVAAYIELLQVLFVFTVELRFPAD